MSQLTPSLISYLTTFVVTGFVSSLTIALCTFSYAAIESRIRHWPLFWAGTLFISLTIPLLGLVLRQLTFWAPILEIERLSMHAPLDYIELTATQLWDKSLLPPEGFSLSLSRLLGGLYLTGLIWCSLRLLIGRRQAHKIVNQARKKHASTGDVYWSVNAATSPFTLTPFGRPKQAKIIIPEQFDRVLSDPEREAIIRHERAHIERRDDEMGLILRLIVILFWFNPIIHMMFDRWKQSAEIQCDAAVTRHAHSEMRRLYAETLLKVFHIMAARVRQYPTASFSNPRLRNAKMRITNIMNGPAPIFKHIGHKLALFLTFALTAGIGAIIISATAHADPITKVKTKVNDIHFMVTGRLTSAYGHVRDPFKTGKTTTHNGIDVAAPMGTPIYAPADGIILEATDLFKNNPAYGTVVVIQTEGETLTMMSHLDKYLVEKGQSVKKGDKIALLGNSGRSTAPHVHIETHKNGERVDPMTIWPFQ